MPPVLPNEFKALIVKPDDFARDAIHKVYVLFPRLLAKLMRYMYNEDGTFAAAFCADVRAAWLQHCKPPEEEE